MLFEYWLLETILQQLKNIVESGNSCRRIAEVERKKLLVTISLSVDQLNNSKLIVVV